MIKKFYKCDKKACGEVCPGMGLCEFTTKKKHRANDLIYAMEGLSFVGYTEEEFDKRNSILKSSSEISTDKIIYAINKYMDALVETYIFVSHEDFSLVNEAMKSDARIKVIATCGVEPRKAIIADKNSLEI